MSWTYLGKGDVSGVTYTGDASTSGPHETITGSVYIRSIDMGRKQPYTDEMVAASEGVAAAVQQLLCVLEPNPFYEVRVRTTQSGSVALIDVYDIDQLEYVHRVQVAL